MIGKFQPERTAHVVALHEAGFGRRQDADILQDQTGGDCQYDDDQPFAIDSTGQQTWQE